jgi:hypothetical protein
MMLIVVMGRQPGGAVSRSSAAGSDIGCFSSRSLHGHHDPRPCPLQCTLWRPGRGSSTHGAHAADGSDFVDFAAPQHYTTGARFDVTPCAVFDRYAHFICLRRFAILKIAAPQPRVIYRFAAAPGT